MKYRKFKEQLNQYASFSVPNNRDLLVNPSQYIQSELLATKTKPFQWLKLLTLSGSLALILCALVLTFHFLPKTRITLDINPALKLTLNHYNRVIDVSGLDEEGDLLVDSLEKTSGSLSSVLESIQAMALADQTLDSLASPMLFGIEGSNYQQEHKIKTIILAQFDLTLTPVIVINQHSEESPDRVYRYAMIEAATMIPSTGMPEYSTTACMTTTAMMNTTMGMTTQSAYSPSTDQPDTTSGVANSDYTVLNYSIIEFRVLAESLSITEAKLQLVLDIFVGYSEYQTYDHLVLLSQLSLQDLYPLYQNLNNPN
ncbi:MAG: hypothetical protein GX582_04745 [Acholeplasmataceae bacterium]|nr:hypothetical protein [Acholeplasmataceae bacterium]